MFMHLAMLFEPILFVAVALILTENGSFEDAEPAWPVTSLIHSAFIGISIAAFASAVMVWRALLSPEKLIPDGGDTMQFRMSYTRAQMISNALALAPPTLGLVVFFVSGSIGFLMGTAAVSLAVMIYTFPRYEALEAMVLSRISQGATLRAMGEEQQKHE